MATWVTHTMIADTVLKDFPQLDARGFYIGNIAPDCNVENEDWTVFTPSREITHWMLGSRKTVSDADYFLEECVLNKDLSHCGEEWAFLLGYYSHLLTDGAFQEYIRDKRRVETVWTRIDASVLAEASSGMERTWDSVKRLISGKERRNWIELLEKEYLDANPSSGYLKYIVPLQGFPDYLEYMPAGCIERKVRIMGYVPQKRDYGLGDIAFSRDEYRFFVTSTIKLVSEKLRCVYERNL